MRIGRGVRDVNDAPPGYLRMNPRGSTCERGIPPRVRLYATPCLSGHFGGLQRAFTVRARSLNRSNLCAGRRARYSVSGQPTLRWSHGSMRQQARSAVPTNIANVPDANQTTSDAGHGGVLRPRPCGSGALVRGDGHARRHGGNAEPRAGRAQRRSRCQPDHAQPR